MGKSKKKSFVLYADSLNVVDLLTDSQAGVLLKALFRYASGLELPEMDAMTNLAFVTFQTHLDRDAQKYAEIVEKRRAAGSKGGAPKGNQNARKYQAEKTSNTSKRLKNQSIQPDSGNGIATDSVSVKRKESLPSTKQYGAYKNVFLSDDDLEKLKKEFPSDWAQRIETLSEAIAVHGYEYKNHLAVIRRWNKSDKRKNRKEEIRNNDQRQEYRFSEELFS